ncbi:MAG: hypothetical protein KJN71_10060 [Acidimicrobiia bacterium]|nr:hypothetical protein [Acidimicrobiia bacterium]
MKKQLTTQGGLIVDRLVTDGSGCVHPCVPFTGCDRTPTDRRAVAIRQQARFETVINLAQQDGPPVLSRGLVELLVGQQEPGAPTIRVGTVGAEQLEEIDTTVGRDGVDGEIRHGWRIPTRRVCLIRP